MPEIQIFDQYMWEAIKPFAVPVIIWAVFIIIGAIIVGSMRSGIVRQMITGLFILSLPVSLYFILTIGLELL
ncbi:hypothetical protein BHE17_08685 [Planococcus maritimus]|uniref:hypothetical protein n=1 Tax=Planococcus maritimus TaxID=192421 RepID=UPI00084C947B|nr:hypothetical protein [Planococcus maritimus]OED32513.1 hypothetical protein BHE17_08685 [Planococcus maritimus]